MDPQIERLVTGESWIEPPWWYLEWIDEVNVTLAISKFEKVLTFTFEKVNKVTNLTLNIVLNEKAWIYWFVEVSIVENYKCIIVF